MKKLFAFGMAAAMTLSLAACGGAASSAAPSEAASEASSEAASSEAAAESTDATGKTWVIATDTVFKPLSTPMPPATLSALMLILLRPSPRTRALTTR